MPTSFKVISIAVLMAAAFLATTPITSAAPTAPIQYEIQVSLPGDQQPASWWTNLTSLLGIRVATRLHPDPGTVLTVQASAYAPSPYQTDATPCVTAAGTRVRKGVVATNFLPMGTILEINGERYIVEDRMNPRYAGYYMDVWLPSTSEALVFGRKKLQITIVEYGKPGQDLNPTPSPAPEQAQVVDSPGFLDRVKNSVAVVSNGLASFIGTRVSSNANVHDIDCFSDEVPHE